MAALLWLVVTACDVHRQFTNRHTARRGDVSRQIFNWSKPRQTATTPFAWTSSRGPLNTTWCRRYPTRSKIGSFTADTDNPVALNLFENVPDLTEVTIEPQTIKLVYDSDAEADLMLRRARRPVINAVLNNADTIEAVVSTEADKTLIFTTSDSEWRAGSYVPSLVGEGEQETYATREAGASGSPLAQFIFDHVNSLEALTINPGSLIVTYRAGAVERQVVNRVQEALNDFYPRASLRVDLWLFTLSASSEKILAIHPLDTGIPLYIFALVIAVIELGVFFYFRSRDDKLVRPLLRVVSVFFFCWSIFGHEPLWDFILIGSSQPAASWCIPTPP